MAAEVSEAKHQCAIAHELGLGAPCLKCTSCPGLDLHFWRKMCRNCYCRLQDHKIDSEPSSYQSVARNIVKVQQQHWEASLSAPTPAPRPQQVKSVKGSVPAPAPPAHVTEQPSAEVDVMFASKPRGINNQSVKKFAQALPAEKCPLSTEAGKKYHIQQLQLQLPAHDFDPGHWSHLDTDGRKKMEDLAHMRQTNTAGQGYIVEQSEPNKWVCTKCNQAIHHGEMVVFADLCGPNHCWHPACFTCSTCKELLVDLIYFLHAGKIHCGRHFNELVHPRCGACDELIFAREYTKAEGKDFHLNHFCCLMCDAPLAGQKYVMRIEQPHCLECYNQRLAKRCAHCAQPIRTDQQRLHYENLYWHGTGDCFSCRACGVSLIQKEFVMSNNNTYCSAKCVRGQ